MGVTYTTRNALLAAIRDRMEAQHWERAVTPTEGCTYWHPDRRTGCALGCLAPGADLPRVSVVESEYLPLYEEFEGVDGTADQQRVLLERLGLDESLRDLAYELQQAHDGSESSAEWKSSFEEIEETWGTA